MAREEALAHDGAAKYSRGGSFTSITKPLDATRQDRWRGAVPKLMASVRRAKNPKAGVNTDQETRPARACTSSSGLLCVSERWRSVGPEGNDYQVFI